MPDSTPHERPAGATIARRMQPAASTRPSRIEGPIVFAADRSYAMPLATALRSLADACPSSWPLKVHVLCSGFAAEAQRRVEESVPAGSVQLDWVPVGLDVFAGLRTPDYISPMTFARLLIPQVIPAGVRRVLYLDCDLLVLDDLAPLWHVDLGDAVVGAVPDALEELRTCGGAAAAQLPGVSRYFNAGVLLIDLEKWRDRRISQRAAAYLAAHPHCAYADQDALNAVCDGSWKPLDAGWNFQGHLKVALAEMPPHERPRVAHFVTSRKPWLPRSASRNRAFYDAFRGRTCFARRRPQVVLDSVSTLWYVSRRAAVAAIRARERGASRAAAEGTASAGQSSGPMQRAHGPGAENR